MDTLLQDLRYAFRQLARTPAFTVLAVLTLAIGIGANTALFTLASAVLARPLPGVHDAASLVWLANVSQRGGRAVNMSYPDYVDYRDSAGVFSTLATMSDAQFSLALGGQPERVRGQFVTGNYFSTLRTPMAYGRGFAADDDRESATHPAAVVSYDLWRNRLDADPAAIGRSILINGRAVTVIGVAAEGFNGPDHGERRLLWVPMALRKTLLPAFPDLRANRNAWWLKAIGRLQPGISRQRANAAVATVAGRIALTDSASHEGITARTFDATSGLTPGDGDDIYPIATLAGFVTLIILLIACANVSNLLLGRAVARRRELGVRLSLGASRARVVRQLLTESVVLAVMATGLGFLLSLWSTDLLAAVIPAPLDIAPDRTVLAFTISVAAVTALLFGLVPSLSATRGDFTRALKDATPGLGVRRSRLQGGFVVAQISLSLVLLVTAGMFLSSLYKSGRINVGFDASTRVLALGFDLGLQGYSPDRATAFVDQLDARAGALPGAQLVSFTNQVPMGERLIGSDVTIETATGLDSTRFAERGGMETYLSTIRPHYFQALAIPMVEGRDFTASDVPGSMPVVIVSQDFAARAWPHESAIGKRVRLEGREFHTVVGVARAALTAGVKERSRPTMYIAQRQFPRAMDLTLLVRAAGDASQLASALRREIRALDANLPVFGVQTLARYRDDRLSESRLGSTLLGIFGALALLLATIGVYAVMAFTVGQRTREIGVRVALGALERQITALFVGQGMRLTLVGVVIGLALSAGVAKLLSSVFFGLSASDVLPFTAVTVLLAAVAATASWIPARRAARVDPMEALRNE